MREDGGGEGAESSPEISDMTCTGIDVAVVVSLFISEEELFAEANGGGG